MKNILIIVLIACTLSKCASSQQENNYLGNDVRLFKDTPAWDIANAIKNKDTLKLKKLVAEAPKNIINYQENKFGQSLLIWSIYSDHYTGFRMLAEAGADITITAKDNTRAINWAANKYETSNYLKALLKRNANVNYVANDPNAERLRTPLIAAAWYSLELTEMLVEAGANVNYFYSENEKNNSPLYSAFRGGKITIINYLITKAKANTTRALETTLNGDSIYAVNMLRTLTFDIGSEEYKQKMEVVAFLKKQGIDYWKTPIPKHYYELYDKAYLEKY